MFSKILIANRGEIAVRAINECRQMGIQTVAVCSDIERDALHMQVADEGYCIGSASIKDSYMNADAIINATLATRLDAIYPGYGFLSEKAEFVKLCEKYSIPFIGPDSDTLTQIGDKITAKKVAASQNIPILKGYIVENIDDALLHTTEIGYPVMLKISDSGGGAGMKPVYCDDELKKAFETLQISENGKLLIEKYIEKARHIEIQIMADSYGNVVTLGSRECSIQQNNKKVLEECPAQNLSTELLNKLYADSLKLAQAVNYVGVGTVEFLVDKAENCYFMEMNARIQVEHSITEMISGINLVQWQIKIAAGEKISFTQDNITFNGYSIECRINALNCGKIVNWKLDNSKVRFDHALVDGIIVTPYYDALLGKLISHGQTRNDAIRKIQVYLNDLQINGIETNIELHKRILNNESFLNGIYFTNFLKSEVLYEEA